MVFDRRRCPGELSISINNNRHQIIQSSDVTRIFPYQRYDVTRWRHSVKKISVRGLRRCRSHRSCLSENLDSNYTDRYHGLQRHSFPCFSTQQIAADGKMKIIVMACKMCFCVIAVSALTVMHADKLTTAKRA